MTSVRVAAARVVALTSDGQTTLAAAIDRERQHLADDRDRGLLVELAAGTLRWRAELDAIIAAASARQIEAIDPTVRAILRVATYQLRHLDRVPAHAAIDEAVESARVLGQTRATGFVNAVLRGIQRRGAATVLPARPEADAGREAEVAYLSVTLSHPAWLVTRWIDRYGFDAAEAWCRFNNATPTVTVRAAGSGASDGPDEIDGHGEFMDRDDLFNAVQAASPGVTKSASTPGAMTLPPGALGRLPADLRSALVVQDEGSQLVAHVVQAEAGMRCLDVCAAPGGKTSMLWKDMRHDGLLVACDRRPGRMRLLASTLHAAAVPLRLVALDATHPLPFADTFDRVLVDAPCSGLGTLRRDPDLKWTRTDADLPRLAATQRAMLSAAAGAVRPGGHLVYATCSSEPDENEDVVSAWIGEHPEFRLAAAASEGPETPFVDARGYFRTMPFRDGLDAFFAAVLVRA